MKTRVKVILLVGMVFLLSACNSVWEGPAEITTANGQVLLCPKGLRFKGDIVGDSVICLGSGEMLGNDRDLQFFLNKIISFSAKVKN